MESVKMADIAKEATLEDVKPNIFQRMLAIENELKTVGKNLDVSTGYNKSYKAVSERDILDAVKPLEAKHGVYSYPYSREIVSEDVLERESKNNGKRLEFFMRIRTTFRFVNIDNPQEFIEVVSYADGIDSGDKATGKAMTYGDKYALMKAYKISTGDDPDQEASGEYTRSGMNQQEIQQLTKLWSDNRRRMDTLGIDYRNPEINDWICKAINAPNHDACNDVKRMKDINHAYDILIKRQLQLMDGQRMNHAETSQA